MQDQIEVIPIENTDENHFLKFLKRDKILHIFTIYDLLHVREKTKVWVALEDSHICGYLLVFDDKIVHTHGTTESLAKLLDCVRLNEPTFVIEPNHLPFVKERFEPTEPTDSSSKTKITNYLIMKLKDDAFTPSKNHRAKKLTAEDLGEVSKRLGEEWKKRVEDVIRRDGLAFGAYEKDELVSLATVSEFADNVALIRGVYTDPSKRNRGLATSALSALAEQLIRVCKQPMLWVARDNHQARSVYEKLGFQPTVHAL